MCMICVVKSVFGIKLRPGVMLSLPSFSPVPLWFWAVYASALMTPYFPRALGELLIVKGSNPKLFCSEVGSFIIFFKDTLESAVSGF